MQTRNLHGMGWMVLDSFVMSLILLCGKSLGLHGVHPMQVICLVNAIAALIGLGLSGAQLGQVLPRHPILHLERAVLGIASTGCLLGALHMLSLYEVSAFMLLIPIVTGLAAVLVFREKADAALGVSMAVSLAGVATLLSAQHDGAGLPRPVLVGAALCCGAILFSVLNNLNQKRIGVQERMEAQRVFGPLFSAGLTLPLAVYLWRDLDLVSLGVLAAYGVLLAVRMSTRFLAFRSADVSVLMPFEYTQLLFAALWSAVLFGQSVAAVALVGMLLIGAGGALLVRREAIRAARISAGSAPD